MPTRKFSSPAAASLQPQPPQEARSPGKRRGVRGLLSSSHSQSTKLAVVIVFLLLFLAITTLTMMMVFQSLETFTEGHEVVARFFTHHHERQPFGFFSDGLLYDLASGRGGDARVEEDYSELSATQATAQPGVVDAQALPAVNVQAHLRASTDSEFVDNSFKTTVGTESSAAMPPTKQPNDAFSINIVKGQSVDPIQVEVGKDHRRSKLPEHTGRLGDGDINPAQPGKLALVRTQDDNGHENAFTPKVTSTIAQAQAGSEIAGELGELGGVNDVLEPFESDGKERTNVVVIVTDELQWNHIGLARQGSESTNPNTFSTPNIDRLFNAGGIFFRNTFAPETLSKSNFLSLLTGRMPENCLPGDGRTAGQDAEKPPCPSLYELLRINRYQTQHIGKWENINSPGLEVPGPPTTTKALRKEFSAYARSRGFSPPDAALQMTILDIQQLTKAEGVDLDQIPGVPHVITLPHKVTDVPAEQRFDRFIAHKAARAIEKFHGTGHPFGITVGFADPSPPYVALRRLYEKHLADSGLSDSSQEDDDVVADGHELDDISLNVQIPSTVGHNATEKAWHSAIANALRSDPDRIRKVVALKSALVEEMDSNVGVILDTLERLQLTDKTMIVFTSLTGALLGDFGMLTSSDVLKNAMLHIPLAMRIPGRTSNSVKVVKEAVSTIDIAPTIAQVLNLAMDLGGGRLAHKRFLGQSLKLVLKNSNTPPLVRDFAPTSHGTRYIVQDGSFKLVYAAGDSLSFFNVKNDHAESRSLVKKNCKIKERFRDEFVQLLARMHLWLEYSNSSHTMGQIPGCDLSPVQLADCTCCSF
eukprot:INCI13461.12.p1 GENE.INCI13461.12~~INCI13461.12.p1  ORF type:complete len:848 (+),score=122.45 INCI13461.12:99-2546(+)